MRSRVVVIPRVPAVLTVLALVLVASVAPATAQSGTIKKLTYGEVVSVTRTMVELPPSGTGAVVGSTAGAVAGYALASGRDRWLGGLLGGAIGGAIGRSAEKASRKKKGWELIIRIEGGEEIAVEIPGKKQQYQPGDRVRLSTGPNGKTQVNPA